MLHAHEIWQIMSRYMPRGRWVSVSEIRTIVELHAKLDREDYEPEVRGSNIPKRCEVQIFQSGEGMFVIYW